MLIFLDNNCGRDFLALRTARLLAIKTYIMAWKDILMIPDHLVNWGLAAYDRWVAALGKSQAEMGEERVAYEQMHTADELTFAYYAKCKALILDTYGMDSAKLTIYGVEGRFPQDRKRRIAAVQDLIHGHARLVATGDPDVLPPAFIAKLQGYFDASNLAFSNYVLKESPEARTAVDEQDALFNEDTEMLRVLYSWVLMTWAKSEPNLVQLGFAPLSEEGQGGSGGNMPAVPEGFELKWLEPFLKFWWNPVEGATSYQLAFSADNGASWEELYSGPEVGFEFEPPAGKRLYRVRARNANGFGDWSATLEHEVEGEPPANMWPNAPEVVGAELITDPGFFMRVFYSIPGGSDTINLYRAVVPTGSPAPERPAVVFQTDITAPQFADTDIEAGNDYYYWACGVKGGEEGEFAGPAMASV